MITLTAVFIAGFLSCLALCWIAYTFYTSFWQHFHQKQVKNEEVVEELYEEIYEKEVEVQKERETEDPHSKILEILDRMNEEKYRQQELALALWRRFKDRFFEDSELTAEYSEEEEANLQFWYDQWILLENYLFGKKDFDDFDDLDVDEGDLN